MNFDEFGIRKKDINEKRIYFIQRGKSFVRNFQSSGKLGYIYLTQNRKMKAAKIFFVVYTLGLDARVLTGKYQLKSFEKYAIAQEFETDKEASLDT